MARIFSLFFGPPIFKIVTPSISSISCQNIPKINFPSFVEFWQILPLQMDAASYDVSKMSNGLFSSNHYMPLYRSWWYIPIALRAYMIVPIFYYAFSTCLWGKVRAKKTMKKGEKHIQPQNTPVYILICFGVWWWSQVLKVVKNNPMVNKLPKSVIYPPTPLSGVHFPLFFTATFVIFAEYFAALFGHFLNNTKFAWLCEKGEEMSRFCTFIVQIL